MEIRPLGTPLNYSNGSIHHDPFRDRMTSYRGGTLSELDFGHPQRQSKIPRSQVGGGTRGQTRGLSRSSRLEFLRKHAKLNADKVLEEGAVLVTLTFPQNLWVDDAANLWKESREKFKRRLDRWDERNGGKTLGSWRLELAGDSPHQLHPHFHLLLFSGIVKRPLHEVREIIRTQWWESCGRLSEDHLCAGTSVKKISTHTDWGRLTRYSGKVERYQATTIPATGKACGWWGWKEIDNSFIDPEMVKLSRDKSIEVREKLAGRSGYELPDRLYSMKTFIPFEESKKMLNTNDERN